MSEKDLLEKGYKRIADVKDRNCDIYYQKKINDSCFIGVYYYDLFKLNGELDYAYEFVIYRDMDTYSIKKLIYGIDKKYTLEKIEKILIGEVK